MNDGQSRFWLNIHEKDILITKLFCAGIDDKGTAGLAFSVLRTFVRVLKHLKTNVNSVGQRGRGLTATK